MGGHRGGDAGGGDLGGSGGEAQRLRAHGIQAMLTPGTGASIGKRFESM